MGSERYIIILSLVFVLFLLSTDHDHDNVCDSAYQEYYIIAGVVGGILLVTMVILFTVVVCGKLRYERRKKMQGEVV